MRYLTLGEVLDLYQQVMQPIRFAAHGAVEPNPH
jgi:hypothetical protein